MRPRTTDRSTADRGEPGLASVLGVLAATVLLATVACDDTAVTPPLDEGTLALELVTDQVTAPVHVVAPPGDDRRLFVLERAGRIRVVLDGSLLEEPFLDISDETSTGGERGLLGLAFHPDYATNGLLFVHHTDLSGDTHVVRYSATSADVADPASAVTILQVPQPYANHNGGQIAFGPDGHLYIGLGDGGSGGDPEGNGQDPTTLLGAILRIDVDGGAPYAIPGDNPFADDPDGADEIWVYGLRNPWRFSFDRGTGDLWIGDVGQASLEEISFQSASSGGGENFGWNVMEGTRCFQAETCDTEGLSPPVYEYDHDEGCSVTGGYVYRGGALPQLDGRYVFGDFCTGFIRTLRLQGGEVTDVVDLTDQLGTVDGLASFGEDAAGELYVVDIDGAVYRLVDAS